MKTFNETVYCIVVDWTVKELASPFPQTFMSFSLLLFTIYIYLVTVPLQKFNNIHSTHRQNHRQRQRWSKHGESNSKTESPP